jgi:hypothetical protein
MHGPSREALQFPLGGVKRNSERVIEVRVGDENVRQTDQDVGAPADVERETQFAHAEVRFVSGARFSFEREALGDDAYRESARSLL